MVGLYTALMRFPAPVGVLQEPAALESLGRRADSGLKVLRELKAS